MFSCASRPPVLITYPLLTETVQSEDGAFTGQVPRGWYSAGKDTIPPGVSAWLLRDDFSAALAVKEISLDRLSAQRVREQGLRFLAELSLGFRNSPTDRSKKVQVSEFDLNNRKFCGYELRQEGKEWKSIIVFAVKGRYYECEALSNNTAPDFVKTIFAAQQAFLSSLR